jgi:hypothetical protein
MRPSKTLSIVFFLYAVLLLLFCVRQAFAAEGATLRASHWQLCHQH